MSTDVRAVLTELVAADAANALITKAWRSASVWTAADARAAKPVLDRLERAWAAARAALAAEAPASEPVAQSDVESLLRAMARNYSNGHCWDHLDSKAILRAADALRQAQAERDEARRDYEGACKTIAAEAPFEQAHRWATELAVSMHAKFYPEVAQWKPLPDLVGVITQIDNMSTGLMRKPATEPVSGDRNCSVCDTPVLFGSKHCRAVRSLESALNQAQAELDTMRQSYTTLLADRKTIHEAIEPLTRRVASLECALHEAREFLMDQVDTVDGPYGEPAPNDAAVVVNTINFALGDTP